jgi:hypothetical protein
MSFRAQQLEEGVFANGGRGLKWEPPLLVATQRVGKRGNRSHWPGENSPLWAFSKDLRTMSIGKNQSLLVIGSVF